MARNDTNEPRNRPRESELETTVSLLQRYRAGDLRARDRLIERYRPILSRWVLSCPPRVRHDAAVSGRDLVQETFVRALKNLDELELRREGAFLAWLRTIFLTLVRQLWRDSERRPE